MITPSLDNIREAQTLLARHFGPTRLARASWLGSTERDVYLKIETELPTGTFKVRGAIYALSVHVANGTVREVVAASTGNHGAAVAYAGRLLGVPATIFLPADPNPVKAARVRDLGARLIERGADLTAAIDRAREYATRTGACFLHDASDASIPIGTGTIGAEILDQLPTVEVIYVPMGDTALIRGVASAAKQLKPGVRVVGVVAQRAPAYQLSWQQGVPVETDSATTIADGLAVRVPLAPNVAAIRALVDDVVAVSEDEMLDAIAHLQSRQRVIAEPAGAAATAAFVKRSRTPGTSVLLVTGGNIAPDVMARVASCFA